LTGIKPHPGGKLEISRGVAEIKDERLLLLKEVFQSGKTSPLTVEYLDAPPLESGGLKKESFRQNFLRGLGQADALLFVVPYFSEEHKLHSLKLVKDTETEFILCDLIGAESRLEKIKKDLSRGAKGDIQKEEEILKRCKIALEEEIPLKRLEFCEDEMKRIRGFSFISLKPLLLILNISESELARPMETVKEAVLPDALPICAKIEAEIADLEPEDRASFLTDLGLQQSARDRIIADTYRTLDLITFLTAGEKEAHAWSLKRGSSALKAAGVIHSDMEKGFIRAEVFSFDDLRIHPLLAELKSKGLIRLEGKDYIVQEGDVILFRFSV
jgi:GTP-binding protein YchF